MKKTYLKPEALLEQMDLEQLMEVSLIDSDANPEEPVLSRDNDDFKRIFSDFEF